MFVNVMHFSLTAGKSGVKCATWGLQPYGFKEPNLPEKHSIPILLFCVGLDLIPDFDLV